MFQALVKNVSLRYAISFKTEQRRTIKSIIYRYTVESSDSRISRIRLDFVAFKIRRVGNDVFFSMNTAVPFRNSDLWKWIAAIEC